MTTSRTGIRGRVVGIWTSALDLTDASSLMLRALLKLVLVDQKGRALSLDRLQVHRAFFKRLVLGQIVHDVDEGLFEDGPEAPRARSPLDGQTRRFLQGVFGKTQLDPFD